MALIQNTDHGLWCERGGFFIDPWKPVDRAIITHGHSDHARWGMKSYLCTPESAPILRCRLGDVSLQTLAYGGELDMNGVRVSLHPAGHLLGSAQVRVEHGGEVWVVTGDYKRQSDATCADFEVVPCTHFITESTFGLPIYRWPDPAQVFGEINAWWRDNQEKGRMSILFSYALGKAQRLLAGVDPAIGPILCHGAMTKLNDCYAEAGVSLPETIYASPEAAKEHKGKALVIAPPSVRGTSWLRKFQPHSIAMASGWMRIRGTRRIRAMDRGFVLSDHVDWPDLIRTIKETGAENIGVTHGYTTATARWLNENGWKAWTIATRFEGEVEEEAEAPQREDDN